MLNKIKLLSDLNDQKLVSVVRAESSEKAVKISEAVVEGGINFIEVTFTVPNAEKAISQLRKKYLGEDEVYIGAGSCMDSETARLAILSGAEFIVSPTLDKNVIKICNRYRVPVIPGIQTPTEALWALDYGVDVVKLFPSRTQGPSLIKDLKGPMPQTNIMPTGGINVSNLVDWLEAGAFAVGVGGSLTSPAKTGDFTQVTENARDFVEVVKDYYAKSE